MVSNAVIDSDLKKIQLWSSLSYQWKQKTIDVLLLGFGEHHWEVDGANGKTAKRYGTAAAAPATSFLVWVLSKTSYFSRINLQIFTPHTTPLPSDTWGHVAKNLNHKNHPENIEKNKGGNSKGARCVVVEECSIDKWQKL